MSDTAIAGNLLDECSLVLCVDALAERALGGDARAKSLLGLLYELGHGVPRDDAVAARWYESAALDGEAAGWFGLGLLCETGRLDGGDCTRAATLYRRAADGGHDGARYRLRLLWSAMGSGRK